jgi:hypothetical protein
MRISEINHREKVTYITTKLPGGKTTLNIICWRTPSNIKPLNELTLGGELIADVIDRESPELKAKLQKISDDMKKRICDDADKFLAGTAKPTK